MSCMRNFSVLVALPQWSSRRSATSSEKVLDIDGLPRCEEARVSAVRGKPAEVIAHCGVGAPLSYRVRDRPACPVEGLSLAASARQRTCDVPEGGGGIASAQLAR